MLSKLTRSRELNCDVDLAGELEKIELGELSQVNGGQTSDLIPSNEGEVSIGIDESDEGFFLVHDDGTTSDEGTTSDSGTTWKKKLKKLKKKLKKKFV